MSPYCTVSDVNVFVPQAVFKADSRPTADTVQTIIANTSTRIDATLANLGYVVPVTGPLSLALLKELCVWGALGQAQQIRETGVRTQDDKDGKPVKNLWLRMFEEQFACLQDPDDPYELPDAPRTALQVDKTGLDAAGSAFTDLGLCETEPIRRDQVL